MCDGKGGRGGPILLGARRVWKVDPREVTRDLGYKPPRLARQFEFEGRVWRETALLCTTRYAAASGVDSWCIPSRRRTSTGQNDTKTAKYERARAEAALTGREARTRVAKLSENRGEGDSTYPAGPRRESLHLRPESQKKKMYHMKLDCTNEHEIYDCVTARTWNTHHTRSPSLNTSDIARTMNNVRHVTPNVSERLTCVRSVVCARHDREPRHLCVPLSSFPLPPQRTTLLFASRPRCK